MRQVHIAIIAGGPSAEATVSRSSAAEVLTALRENFDSVDLLELDSMLAAKLLDLKPELVFPVLHGPPGEDGTVQGFLEILGLPYVGSDVHASAAAMDKNLAKAVFRAIGLPLCSDLLITSDGNITQSIQRIQSQLGKQVVLKPLNQGSALGVIPILEDHQLKPLLSQALVDYGQVLVETFISGREMTVGVLDQHGKTPLLAPVIEIRTPPGSWYDYEHRYDAHLSEHIVPAPIDATMAQRMQEMALRAHLALGCRDLSRADFIMTKNQQGEERIVLLEINTLPGMTPTSLYPDGMAALGVSFPSLMKRLVESALARSAETSIYRL